MFVSINRTGDRYEFVLGESSADDQGAFFRSSCDFYLVSGLRSTYASFHEAHDQAMIMIGTRPSHIQAKKAAYYKRAAESDEMTLDAEESAVDHYGEQVSIIHSRMKGIESLKGKDKKDGIAQLSAEVDSLLQELMAAEDMAEDKDNLKELADLISQVEEMQSKLPKPPKPPATMPQAPMAPPDAAGQDFMVAASARAADAIRSSHPEAYLWKLGRIEDEDRYEAVVAEPSDAGDKPILILGFDSSFILDSVMPSDEVSKEYPYHSVGFLDRYWEPSVRGVGHFSPRGASFMIVPGSSRSIYGGFNKNSGIPVKVAVSTPESGSWAFRPEKKLRKKASKISEGDEVVCSAKRIPSYYGRTGDVTAVRSSNGYMEYRVDFRQGLGPCWLEESDVGPTLMP